MRKLFYLVESGYSNYQGLQKKVHYQIESMKKNGFDVTLVVVGNNVIIGPEDNKKKIGVIYLERRTNHRFLTSIEDFVNVLIFTIGLGKGDLIYTRYDTLTFFLTPRNCTVITEHNTKEIVERRINKSGSPLIKITELLFGKLNRKLRDGFIAVTEEIEYFESKYYGRTPSIVISNGIDVSSIRVSKRKGPVNGNFYLLGLANVSVWHGYDRVIKGIHNYKGSINVIFHIVGNGSELNNLKRLAKDLCVEDSIVFHGQKEGSVINDLFDQCQMAIGVLGLHRINMLEGSNLKHREFCARGMPFVDSTVDRDFQNFPYRLQLESNDEPIDIDQLIVFFNSCSDADYPTIMRNYSFENLDWTNKIKALASFIDDNYPQE